MSIAIQDPGGSLALWASMIPFSSPIVMMARIPYGVPTTVPYWQLIAKYGVAGRRIFIYDLDGRKNLPNRNSAVRKKANLEEDVEVGVQSVKRQSLKLFHIFNSRQSNINIAIDSRKIVTVKLYALSFRLYFKLIDYLTGGVLTEALEK